MRGCRETSATIISEHHPLWGLSRTQSHSPNGPNCNRVQSAQITRRFEAELVRNRIEPCRARIDPLAGPICFSRGRLGERDGGEGYLSFEHLADPLFEIAQLFGVFRATDGESFDYGHFGVEHIAQFSAAVNCETKSAVLSRRKVEDSRPKTIDFRTYRWRVPSVLRCS